MIPCKILPLDKLIVKNCIYEILKILNIFSIYIISLCLKRMKEASESSETHPKRFLIKFYIYNNYL